MVILTIREKGGKSTWEEKFEDKHFETDAEATTWANDTLEHFNTSLRPDEPAREIVNVRLVGERPKHHWDRVSLVVQEDKDGMFDRMRCRHCHATGRRVPMNASVRLDGPYPPSAANWTCTDFKRKLAAHQNQQDQRQYTRDRNKNKRNKRG